MTVVQSVNASIYYQNGNDFYTDDGEYIYDLSDSPNDRFYLKSDGEYIYGDDEMLFSSDGEDMYFLDNDEEF